MTRFARGGPANKKKPLPASSWQEMKSSEKVEKAPPPKVDPPEEPSKPLSKKAKRRLERQERSKPKGLDSVSSHFEPEPEDNKSIVEMLEGGSKATQPKRLYEADLSRRKPGKKGKIRLMPVIDMSDDDEPNLIKSLAKRDKHEERFGERTNTVSLADRLIGLVSDPSQKDIKNDLRRHLKAADERDREEMESRLKEYVRKDGRRENRRLKRVDQRLQGKICFNCREPGHDMAHCPRVKQSVDHGVGICFKCGSTEHRINNCRAKVPEGEFPYAKCFICGETGHLSKQCQDNPRGLYPKGGCCRHCGSVEHFKKDCDVLQKEQGIEDMRLERMDRSVNVEEECYGNDEGPPPAKKSKKMKVVKF